MKNNKVSSCEYINGEKIYIGDKVYRSGFGIATVYNIKKEGFKSQAAGVDNWEWYDEAMNIYNEWKEEEE